MEAIWPHCPHGRADVAAPAWHQRVAMALLVARRCNSQAVWWWQAWRTDAFLWCSKDMAHRWTRVDELAHPPCSPQLRRRSIGLEAAWRPTSSESTRSPRRASAPRRRVAGGASGSPRAVGWRQGSLPAPASDMAAEALPVHSRRAARPPSLLTIGPEGARLSALSLPDPRPALAPAGVLLAAAASRRPPARHRPQPGADNPGRRRRSSSSRRC